MRRHVTPDLTMLTGDWHDGERRTVDLIIMSDGREAAVIRHYTQTTCTSWHITPDIDPDATDMQVSMFHDLYSDDADVIDWYMPREAVEQFILTAIAATH